MFTAFLFHLRACGLAVSVQEWLALVEALTQGQERASLSVFYHLARALLIKRESDYDTYDRAFAEFFDTEARRAGAEIDLESELSEWLRDPAGLHPLTDEQRTALRQFDLEELREAFEKRLAEQRERHDGGSRFIGTGGSSPFGHSGEHPTGVRVGGASSSRSAIQVATDRRFRNLRSDRVLDTRQINVALRRLRQLDRRGSASELDLEATIDNCARNGGEIELIFSPPKRNRIKLLLLIDVGGSMDPHADLCERLFSAAHAASHFAAFESRYFHNCVYETLYTDMARRRGEATAEVLAWLDTQWSLAIVGDAWMSPFELTHAGGAIDYFHHNPVPGIGWLQRLSERCGHSVWLNPEPQRFWQAPSIRMVGEHFPMFELTLDGLSDAVDVLSGRKSNPQRRPRFVTAER